MTTPGKMAVTVGAARAQCQAGRGRERGGARTPGALAARPRLALATFAAVLVVVPAAALLAALAVAGSASADASPIAVREVSPGHFVHVGRHEDMSPGNRGDIANGGFVIGRDGVAAIDPGGGASVARELARALRERSALPLTHVILTHFHPDHVLGARAFVAAAGGGSGEEGAVEVLAHAAHARAAAQRGAFYLDRYAALVDGAEGFLVPTIAVEPGEPVRVELGGRTLSVRAHGVGHTDNDVTAFEAASGTLWAGDLLVAERTPSLDGSLRGWLAVLDELEALAPRTVVFGHGEPGALPAPLAAQRDYLESLLGGVRERLDAGGRLQDALADAERASPGHWRLFALHHPTNVTRAWAELEWE